MVTPKHTMGAIELRRDVRRTTLTAFAEEYRDAAEIWRTLETKAQTTITVSGIFLAAAFAYARESRTVEPLHQVLLVGSIILLVASVTAALLSLRVRAVAAVPLGRFMAPAVRDLEKQPDAEVTDEVLDRFEMERIQHWQSTVESMISTNSGKGELVFLSQCLLVGAMLPAAAFTIYRMFG